MTDLEPLSFVSYPYPTFHLLMPLYGAFAREGPLWVVAEMHSFLFVHLLGKEKSSKRRVARVALLINQAL